MSYKIGNVVVLCREPDGECEYCGKIDELRPYGRNGARICCKCGDKNPEETTQAIYAFLDGPDTAGPKFN